MTDGMHDIGELLRSSDRPRALTDAERSRMLDRLATGEEPLVDRRRDVTELDPTPPRTRSASRLASAVMAIGTGVAAISLLFVFLSLRDPVRPRPAVPLASIPTATLPAPSDDSNDFCEAHVDVVSNALERWRGIENWAFAGGAPDVGQLVDEALEAAVGFGDATVSNQAASALDRLREDLAQIDPDIDDRNAIAPKTAAVDDALAALLVIVDDITPPCDLERLSAARDL